MTAETALPIPTLSILVEAGVDINALATFAGISAVPKKLRSDAVDMVQAVIDAMQSKSNGGYDDPELLRKLKLWVLCVKRAQELGPEYAFWVARHVLESPGTTDQVWSQLLDVNAWVSASLRKQVPQHVFNAISWKFGDPGPYPNETFVGRTFEPRMTLKTAIKLTEAWREALSKEMETQYSDFPAPWLPPCVVGDYNIIPITHCAELYREGHHLRDWGIGSKSDKVDAGTRSFYSIRKNQERVATLELARKGETVELYKIHGFLDPQITTKVMAVVEPWLRESRGLCLPTVHVHDDDELPF